MYLYFQNRFGYNSLVARARDKEDLFKEMHSFLKVHHYQSPYIRTWREGDVEWIDVGSHSEFFLISEHKLSEKDEQDS